MIPPAKPSNESDRLNTLRSLNILDTLPEERFDRLTRLATRLFNVPIALVTLVDADRQWFKSSAGLSANQTGRDISFCGHAILGDDILAVPDAQLDERFYDNPLVTGDPHIRFYAGCPLSTPNGFKLGTLCVIDTNPRKFNDEDFQLLRDLTRIVEEEIAAVQLATMDELTLLSNRRGFEILAQHALNVCKRLGRPSSLLFFDLNDFKQINDRFGHAEGDFALKAFANILRTILRDSDVIGRLGGDEFVALLTDSVQSHTSELLLRLKQALDEYNTEAERGYDIRYSVGQVEYNVERHPSIESLILESDTNMYANKKQLKASGGGTV
jgi:diguanylate cyclase (GGDEF)-like protein